MYTLNIWGTIFHLIPPFLFCVLTQQWPLYIEARLICLYFYVTDFWVTPFEPVLGEPVIVENELMVYIWSGINLSAVVCWTVYYVCFIWRERIWSEGARDKVNLDQVLSGKSDGRDTGNPVSV